MQPFRVQKQSNKPNSRPMRLFSARPRTRAPMALGFAELCFLLVRRGNDLAENVISERKLRCEGLASAMSGNDFALFSNRVWLKRNGKGMNLCANPPKGAWAKRLRSLRKCGQIVFRGECGTGTPARRPATSFNIKGTAGVLGSGVNALVLGGMRQARTPRHQNGPKIGNWPATDATPDRGFLGGMLWISGSSLPEYVLVLGWELQGGRREPLHLHIV